MYIYIYTYTTCSWEELYVIPVVILQRSSTVAVDRSDSSYLSQIDLSDHMVSSNVNITTIGKSIVITIPIIFPCGDEISPHKYIYIYIYLYIFPLVI